MRARLESLLRDPEVCEILFHGPEHIHYEKFGRLQSWPDRFPSEQDYEHFIHELCAEAGVHTNLKYPAVDGSWRGFRLHLIQSPLVNSSFHLSLRRHPDSPWTFGKLREANWATDSDLEILMNLVETRQNLLVVGPTASGKTSTLTACLQLIGANERAVIIEDTNEIKVPNPISVKLLTRFDQNGVLKNFDLSDLVKHSLRMRPDRIIMGEVRGPEAKDLILALATGHQGSMGTLHAQSARQALIRLEMLIQLGAPDWSLEAVRQLIQLSIQAIVVTGVQKGQRRLLGVQSLAALDKVGFLLEELTNGTQTFTSR